MELYGVLIASEGESGGSGGNGGATVDIPIKTISVNGVPQPPLNKRVNIDVPTKISELENDSNYLTETELNSKDYADKTYVGEQIANISGVGGVKRKIVDVLPEASEADDNTVYMIKDDTVTGDNKYKDYMLIDGVLICIGDTSVDLTDYVKSEDISIESISVNGVHKSPVDKNVDIKVPTKISELKNDSNFASTDDIPIKSISVNGVSITPDENNNVNIRISGEGGTGGVCTAEDTSYSNSNYPDYTNVDLALDALFNKVYYVKPTCSLSASPSGGTFEMGTVISAPITFNWSTNKDINTQTLTGCTLADASVRTATYNTNVTADKTFTLSVSDGENSASASVSYRFLNKVFWGSSPTADTYDSAFINALSNKKLASSVKGTYSFNVASGEYGFFAVPSNMTISSVWIGGFEVTVDSVGTVSYTNSQGYTRDYNLYKTGKSGLGSISAEIK